MNENNEEEFDWNAQITLFGMMTGISFGLFIGFLLGTTFV